MIEDCISLTSGSFRNNSINIRIDSNSDLKLKIYDREFKQVVINILNNAKDILIEKLENNRNIKVTIREDKDYGIIKIHDNAGGVPTDILSKIFDPYFSTKSHNGTGLGLYMSKTIIDEHLKGSLSVDNDDDGAVFTIKLPLDKED